MSELRNCASEKRTLRIRKRQQRQQIKQKQNGFVLDCLNSTKSNLKSYTSINDKFLRYFIIKVRPNHRHKQELRNIEKEEERNHRTFQQMLSEQKEKVRRMEEMENMAKCGWNKTEANSADCINEQEEKEEDLQVEEVQHELANLQISTQE